MKTPTLTTLAILFIATPAAANIHQQLSQCSSISDKLERLICFDELAANVDPALALAPAAKASAADTATQATSQVTSQAATANADTSADFGKTKKSASDELQKVYLTVAKVDSDARGDLVVTFTNGQAWRQVDGRRYKVSVGQEVYIERGALGSFLLGQDDRNGAVRVKRVD
ncbi:hypothetical protein FJQ87_18135 [Shewanella sp. SNU WT4]|uniref:hypothetical protein n=1 Tax=Shewanella sp. SNU WT4 TaxID=2590015 RepID=UPI00112C5FA7|nr:hypothetical protein [Shewanella sp. SNU WT4]QDF68342.1 hypothetical protein FJQ87_18135 [Shewanella sp. SNU WT4]